MQLWAPSNKMIEQANVSRFREWVNTKKNKSFSDYHQLWEWSVTEIGEFWETVWQYFDILHDGSFTAVTNGDPMPKTRWFEGVRLNYSEHVFRKKTTTIQPSFLRVNPGPYKK